jgi:hypothetical protein
MQVGHVHYCLDLQRRGNHSYHIIVSFMYIFHTIVGDMVPYVFGHPDLSSMHHNSI